MSWGAQRWECHQMEGVLCCEVPDKQGWNTDCLSCAEGWGRGAVQRRLRVWAKEGLESEQNLDSLVGGSQAACWVTWLHTQELDNLWTNDLTSPCFSFCSPYLMGLRWILNELICEKYSEQCLAYITCSINVIAAILIYFWAGPWTPGSLRNQQWM